MADKSKSKTISLPESQMDELAKFCFEHDTTASHVLATALALALPTIKAHPLLLKYVEFEAVKLQFPDVSRAA